MFVRAQGHFPMPVEAGPLVMGSDPANRSHLHEVGLRKWLWCTSRGGKLPSNQRAEVAGMGLRYLPKLPKGSLVETAKISFPSLLGLLLVLAT